MSLFNPSKEEVRRFFCESWRKHLAREVLQGAEVTAADLIAAHPEYHALLENQEEALTQEFTPEGGKSNPFLHLSLHLALAEQLSVDQPKGIKNAYKNLRERIDVHAAEHRLMECLAEALWRSQREGTPIDAATYIEAIQRSASA